jgi:hypothetical protein
MDWTETRAALTHSAELCKFVDLALKTRGSIAHASRGTRLGKAANGCADKIQIGLRNWPLDALPVHTIILKT